jgi:hypothetical protein
LGYFESFLCCLTNEEPQKSHFETSVGYFRLHAGQTIRHVKIFVIPGIIIFLKGMLKILAKFCIA